jgi:hypothetical protein
MFIPPSGIQSVDRDVIRSRKTCAHRGAFLSVGIDVRFMDGEELRGAGAPKTA